MEIEKLNQFYDLLLEFYDSYVQEGTELENACDTVYSKILSIFDSKVQNWKLPKMEKMENEIGINKDDLLQELIDYVKGTRNLQEFTCNNSFNINNIEKIENVFLSVAQKYTDFQVELVKKEIFNNEKLDRIKYIIVLGHKLIIKFNISNILENVISISVPEIVNCDLLDSFEKLFEGE